MSLATIILLASLGPAQRIHVPQVGAQSVYFKPAPKSGDLVRQGLHPLAVMLSEHRHKATEFEPLVKALGSGGFNRLVLSLPAPAAKGSSAIQAALKWALKQPGVDRERIYLISSLTAGVSAIDYAGTQSDGIKGLLWLSPTLKAKELSVLPLLSKLSPMPILLTADARDAAATSAVTTLRTVLKMRFSDLRRIRRVGMGRGAEQLSKSSSLADQLLITLRTWAEKNCDRTAPKKKTLNEGCKK